MHKENIIVPNSLNDTHFLKISPSLNLWQLICI